LIIKRALVCETVALFTAIVLYINRMQSRFQFRAKSFPTRKQLGCLGRFFACSAKRQGDEDEGRRLSVKGIYYPPSYPPSSLSSESIPSIVPSLSLSSKKSSSKKREGRDWIKEVSSINSS
jgi:hypothetical protein